MPIVAFNPHDTVILFGYGLYAGKSYSVTASIFLFAGHHMSIERNRILLNRIDHFQKIIFSVCIQMETRIHFSLLVSCRQASMAFSSWFERTAQRSDGSIFGIWGIFTR